MASKARQEPPANPNNFTTPEGFRELVALMREWQKTFHRAPKLTSAWRDALDKSKYYEQMVDYRLANDLTPKLF